MRVYHSVLAVLSVLEKEKITAHIKTVPISSTGFLISFIVPPFLGKKALLLSTAGVLGNKEVLDYLKLVIGLWGFEISYRIGIVTPIPISPKEEQEN
jgi:hypothetical protein